MKFYIIPLFCSVAAAGQPLKLDFRTATERLAAQNRDVLAARQNLLTARLSHRGAYSGFLPQLTAGMNYTHGNSATTAQLAGVNTTYELYSASLGVSQSIFSGLSDYYKIKIARANAELAEATYRQTAARAMYELKAAWSQLHLARQQHALALETRARREENVRMIRLRFNSGNENKGSLLLAESYRAQAERDVNQALRQRASAETELRRVLNLGEEEDPVPQGLAETIAPPENADLGALAKVTPEYQQAVAQELSAGATADQSLSPFFPTLTASGSLFRQGPTFFPQGDRWSVTVGVSYPLFSGGKDYYALKANNSAFEASRRNREATESARVAKLQQALQTWRDTVESARVSESLLGASTVRAQIARVKYNNGLLTFDQWDIIENDLINRQKNVLQTRYDMQIAQAAWEQLTGEGPKP